jgi:broad specificity phosphatase PhoE
MKGTLVSWFSVDPVDANTLSDMPPNATVMLVRHGRVANPNHVVYADLPGFDLDDHGVLEAHAVGRHLQDRVVDAVISSPLARAVQTATSIARRHGLAVTIDSGLSEWNLSTSWVGQVWEQLPVVVPGELESYLDNPADLSYATETLSDLASRVLSAVDRHLRPPVRNLVVVAHQDPVAVAALGFTGAPFEMLLSDPPPHASVTTLTRSDDEAWSLQDRWEPSIR